MPSLSESVCPFLPGASRPPQTAPVFGSPHRYRAALTAPSSAFQACPLHQLATRGDLCVAVGSLRECGMLGNMGNARPALPSRALAKQAVSWEIGKQHGASGIRGDLAVRIVPEFLLFPSGPQFPYFPFCLHNPIFPDSYPLPYSMPLASG